MTVGDMGTTEDHGTFVVETEKRADGRDVWALRTKDDAGITYVFYWDSSFDGPPIGLYFPDPTEEDIEWAKQIVESEGYGKEK